MSPSIIRVGRRLTTIRERPRLGILRVGQRLTTIIWGKVLVITEKLGAKNRILRSVARKLGGEVRLRSGTEVTINIVRARRRLTTIIWGKAIMGQARKPTAEVITTSREPRGERKITKRPEGVARRLVDEADI